LYRPCKGTGLATQAIEKTVKVPRFTETGEILQFEQEGHSSMYSSRGESGHLSVKIEVLKDPMIRREGNNIVSKHFVTLSEALFGIDVVVDTIKGS
jgi:DnaJ-class molecular chaperone